MGNLDELDVINPQSPNVGGFIQELDARAAQKANAPISTTVNDVLVSIGAGVPKTAAGFNDALSMTLNSPYALANKLFGTSPDPFGAVATSDQISSTLRGIGDQILAEGLSPEAIAQRQAISAPLQDPNANLLDVALAAIKNPLGSATHIAESAPTLGVGVGAGAMGAKLAGSMARPTMAATKAITKAEAAATGATLANALVNAGETFGELKDQPMLDRYSGASIPLGLSLLFGSGADPMVANRVFGEAVTPISNSLKDVAVNFGKGAVKGGAKEFASEAAEGGSQAVGESVGKREDIDLNKVSKQAMLEGMMGAGQGSVAGGLSNVKMADQQEAKVEDDVAKRVSPVIDALNKLQTELQAQAQQTPVQVEEQPTNSSAEAIKNPAEPIKEPTSTPVEVGAQPINSSAQAIKEPQQIDVQPIEEQIADPDPEDVLDASSGRVDPTALQNRDRSQKGSVSDMHAIANKPDYARVSYSRDFGNGAPVVAYGSVPASQKGRRDVAVGSSGRRIPVQYAVVEADSISTSNDSEGVVNPDYGNTDRVTAIAGNGRLAGLSLAYRQGTAGNYRQALTADKTHGIDPAVIQGMKNPVLVRIMPNNHVTKDIGDESNVQTTSALSAVEQARTDARRINLNGLKFNADGSVSASSLNEFVQAMPASERASMIDKDGRPTVQAVDRANNAIFAQAYNNDSITAMYAQATDPEAKLVINALARLAPKMAQLEGCGELDFRDALIDAVNAIVQGKRDGLSMREIASQQDFLADPDVTLFINLFANNPRSNKDAIEVLSEAADFAVEEANKPEPDMFGAVPRATRSDVMDRARNRFDEIQEEKNAGKANEQEDVLQDADGSVRAEEDATGRDARADQVAPDARGSEITERSEESVTEQAPEQGRPKFSRKATEKKYRHQSRTFSNLTDEEKSAFDEYLDSLDPAEGDRIRNNIERYQDTQWGHVALECVFLRGHIKALMSGESYPVETMLDREDMKKVRKALEGGLRGVRKRLVDNNILADVAKCGVAVNASFLNCNPSPDCAKFCYAAEGRGGIPLTLVKSELTDLVVANDPEGFAQDIYDEYVSTSVARKDGTISLRLFEKGDGDVHWIPLIKALNKRGLRVHVFSKRPEFLRQIPADNLRLLSIDKSNRNLADENPDLPIAFVYQDKEDIPDLARLYERGQVKVTLPVKLDEYMSKSNVLELKQAIKGIKDTICPIDAGSVKIGEWTCERCDATGCAGCYHGDQTADKTQAIKYYLDDTKDFNSMSLAEQAEWLKRSIDVVNKLLNDYYGGKNATEEQQRQLGYRVGEDEGVGSGSDSVSQQDGRVGTGWFNHLIDTLVKRHEALGIVTEQQRKAGTSGVPQQASASANRESSGLRGGERPIRFWGHEKPSRGNVDAIATKQPQIKFSRNHEGSPSAEDVARTLEADKDIGDAFTQLRDNGEVEVVQSVDDLPEEIRSQIEGVKPSIGEKNIKRSDNGDIQGLYDPRSRKVYLIADALTDETAKPVFLHELGVHSAYTKNPLKLETQMKMARNMVNNGVAQGNALAIRVKQRLFDAGEIDSMSDPIPMEAAEECMAYLVEEAASADPRSPFRKWFDKLVAAIKQWLNAHGLNVNLNEWDFVEIAKGNVTAMAREAGRETRLSYSKSGKAPKQSPSNKTPKASKILERDELGRFRLAPGRKLAEKVGQGLSAIDGLLSTSLKFQNAPKELRMQIREMKAKIESAGLTAKEMAEVMQSLSEAERKMISDVVEQELATGVNPPAYVMQIATKISSIMDQQADELVALGMLSSESRDRFRGKYLPRFYMKSQDKEAQSFFARMFGAKQRLRGVAGGHMKGRGIFKEAPLDAVDQFLQLGWTVRDSKFEVVNGKVTPKQGAFASMPKGNEPVMLWRDYTKQEREQMGEIRDASYRFAVGYMETQRDLAIGRLFKAIASNPDWTSPTPRDGFEHVPVTEIIETGGLLKYGALAGKYVDKVVLTHIAHIEEVQDGVKRAYRQMMAFWKEGKTAMNPVSHMNNTVGNFVSAHLAGVDMWDAKTYTKAVKSMMNADALYKEAREAGLFTGSFSQEEFVETMPENLRHLFKSEEGKFKKFGDMFMNVLTWGLRKKMRNAYEMEDALFKMAIYTKCRDAGMEPTESVDYAHRYIFVYDVLPEGARKIRDSVLPFFAWTYQAVPMIARSAVSYPWRFFAPAAILFAINTAYYMSAVGDDDDDWIERIKKARELEKAERGLLPDYMKGSTIFMTPKFLRLGVDESTGLPIYLNTSAMVPGGSFLDFENQMGGIPWPEVIVPSHPVVNAYAAFFANKDAFSGFDMTKKTDTAGEKTQKFAEYAWKQISPAIAVGNYHWTRMMDGIAAETGMTMPFNRTGINRYGEAMTLDTAVKNLAGIKVRAVDFDNELDRKLRGYAYEARQIKSEMRSAGRLAQKGALPKDAATEKIEVGKEKIGKIKEKIDESRRSHADIQRLTK